MFEAAQVAEASSFPPLLGMMNTVILVRLWKSCGFQRFRPKDENARTEGRGPA